MLRPLSRRSMVPVLLVMSLGGAVGPAHAQRPSPKGADRLRPEARNGGGPATASAPASVFDNALRIAQMVHDEALVARLLAMRGAARSATTAELVAVVDAFERAGMPGSAVDFLADRVARFPQEGQARVLLARLHARSGSTARAVEVWKSHIARVGFEALSLEDAYAYARDVSRTGDVDEAYVVLQRMRGRVPDTAKNFWTDLASLAWDRDDDATALSAYDKLRRLDPMAAHVGLRLTTLLADANRHDEAQRVALDDLRVTGDPNAVLLVAHLRAARAEWRAVKALLEAADPSAGALHERPDYFLLSGDCSTQLGDLEGAARAYGAALALVPDDPTARANVLWTALALGNDPQVRARVTAWAATAGPHAELWAPMAAGLAHVGRYEEALHYLRLQTRANPADARALLELSDVLTKLGRDAMARDVRRRAVGRLRNEAAAALMTGLRGKNELHIVESAVLVLSERAGIPQADRWMSALARVSRGLRAEEELATDFYLTTDRPEYARALVQARNFRDGASASSKHRLTLAIFDNDQAEIKRLLGGRDHPLGETRVHGLLAIERDREAAAAIGDTIALDPNAADEPALREARERIGELHRPTVRAGGSYVHVTGLDLAGANASATHDGLGGRITYEAAGARMTDRSGILAMPEPRYEAEAGAQLRLGSVRGVTELAAGATVQPEQGTPVGRATLFDQRLLGARLGLTTDLRAGARIEDTSFLRVMAVRNSISLGLRYDASRVYVSGELEGREDQTRRYQHLAWDAIASAETGIKLLTREPHLSVGVQGQASYRDNRVALPEEALALIGPRIERARVLPPSFGLIGGVVHLSRGDFSERYRPDRAPFPRYDCEAAFGVLVPADTAIHLLCGVSARAGRGYSSLIAFYNRGIAGVRNAENASLSLSYTLPF